MCRNLTRNLPLVIYQVPVVDSVQKRPNLLPRGGTAPLPEMLSVVLIAAAYNHGHREVSPLPKASIIKSPLPHTYLKPSDLPKSYDIRDLNGKSLALRAQLISNHQTPARHW